MMPALELYINPAWNCENLVQRAQLRSGSQGRRDKVPDNLCVEGISCNAHASVPYDVAWDSASFADGRAYMNQGKITGATAEIANKNELIMIQRGFVIMSGGHRLHFEVYGMKAG